MSTNEARKRYQDRCREENQSVLKSKYLLKYERDKHGRQVGVTVAFRDSEGRVKVGWSRCHTKLETFNKHVGINMAIRRAKELRVVDERDAPHPLQAEVTEMLDRARRYFQEADVLSFPR